MEPDSGGPGRRTIRFTDESVPTGTHLAEYTITPMRGTATGRGGPSASVRFGSGGGGGTATRSPRRVAA